MASYNGQSTFDDGNGDQRLSTNGEFLSNLYKNKVNKDEEEAMQEFMDQIREDN